MINGVGKQQQQGSARKKWSHVSDLFLILALFFMKYWIMLLLWTLSSYFSQTIYRKCLMKLPTKTSEMQQEAQDK